MTTDFRALIARMANELDGYRQMLLDDRTVTHRLSNEARAALADEPAVPEGREPASVTGQPSDEELLGLTEDWPATTGPRHDLSGCPEVPLYSVFADEVVDFARAVLARWGRPALQSVPVSERLPGPEDCDELGRCWCWTPPVSAAGSGYWWFAAVEWSEDATYWLPAHALPLP